MAMFDLEALHEQVLDARHSDIGEGFANVG